MISIVCHFFRNFNRFRRLRDVRNLSNRFSEVHVPQDIYARFGRYLYTTKHSWIKISFIFISQSSDRVLDTCYRLEKVVDLSALTYRQQNEFNSTCTTDDSEMENCLTSSQWLCLEVTQQHGAWAAFGYLPLFRASFDCIASFLPSLRQILW